MKSTIFGLALCALCAPVLAAQGHWTEGYGQGTSEYFIDNQGYRLYIACPPQDPDSSNFASVVLSPLKNGADIQQFTISVNGHTFNGPIETGSRVGAQNFTALIDYLRKADAVVKFAGKSITFPKSDAAKVLPTQKKLTCNIF